MDYILPIHNILRWFVLIFGVWAVVNGLTGLASKRNFTNGDDKSSLLFMIVFDIQLLLGLILYFGGMWFDKLKEGMGVVMKDSMLRFFTVEHTVMMLAAWLLVHIGRTSVKRASTSTAKHKKMLVFFGIALLLVLAAIPWPFREAIARPMFRGF